MSDPEHVDTEHRDQIPPGQDPDEAEELVKLAVDDGKGNKVVPISALIGTKKENRELAKRIKELEGEVGKSAGLKERLDQAQPVIDAILKDPKLRAAAIRVSKGTHASAPSTDQPDDDQEATAHAEDMGFYTSDGQLDIARARRVLDRMAGVSRREAEGVVRPLAGLTMGQTADANLRAAKAMADEDGVPIATEQSIDEVVASLGADGKRLLANPQVVDLIVNAAAGLDRRAKRTPKAPEEPLRLGWAGGGPRRSVIDADTKRGLARVGLTEEEFTKASEKLDRVVPGRGVALEG